MGLKNILLQNYISIKSLDEETLLKLFKELDYFREEERALQREIVKELASRNKLFLLTGSR